MTNQEILTKAIQKAVANGWQGSPNYNITWSAKDNAWVLPDTNYYSIIFNHDFAKALWGEEMIWWGFPDTTHKKYELLTWQYHLQQMVIADDPIKYLGEHI